MGILPMSLHAGRLEGFHALLPRALQQDGVKGASRNPPHRPRQFDFSDPSRSPMDNPPPHSHRARPLYFFDQPHALQHPPSQRTDALPTNFVAWKSMLLNEPGVNPPPLEQERAQASSRSGADDTNPFHAPIV